MSISINNNIKLNQNAVLYEDGKAFSEARWLEIIVVYNEIVEKMEKVHWMYHLKD